MNNKFSLIPTSFARCLAGGVALAMMVFGAGLAQGQSSPETFGTAGNTTWTCPANVYSVQVEAWGGGGGGGGCGQIYTGAGGGAGGSYVRYSVAVTPGTVYQLTVGGVGSAGAEGASGTATAGATGSASFFGNSSAGNPASAMVLAVGGPGGAADNTAGTGSTSYHISAGGTGTTSGNVPGSGAAADTAGSNGGTGPGTTKGGGAGGNGAGSSGSSGGGAGAAAITSAGNGNAGTAPGGGGSGGDEGSSFSASNGTGGAGGAGQVVLTWTADTAPVVTASAAIGVTGTTATLNGDVTSAGGTDGGSTIADRGFVYGTSSSLTINSNKTAVSGMTGSYSLNLTGLTGGTTYYFEAYASNSVGLTLSSAQNFTTTGTTPPTLTAASSATVDAPFTITFTDDSTWRGDLTAITVNGSMLTASAYTVSAGQITFTPANDAADSLIRTPGSKTIAVLATSYSSDTVAQSIGVGTASQLAITTQPAAPTSNGGLLTAQPVVVIEDQYGNLTAGTSNIVAQVGAGAWTIGGTTSINAVAGAAAFSNLTATSAANLAGATIQFTSPTLTPVTSSPGFNIPVFAAGNLAVEQLAVSATSSAFSIIELSPSTASQSSPVNTIAIPSTGASALRQTSAATSGRLATTCDGTMLAFTGYEDSTGVTDETTITNRGVGTVDVNNNYTLQTTYTNAAGSGDQTRSATSLDNHTWLIGDKAGVYTNGTSLPANTTNVRPLKSFGGTVYVLSQNTPSAISTLSADGRTVTALPGVPTNAAAVDFYMISSGNNGSAYDMLYVNNGTTVAKYSLVSGSWAENSSGISLGLASGVAADGLCAATNSSGGVYLYVTTGTSNTVVRITDATGYNAAPSINAGNNVTLYTAASGYLKGIAFAPQKATPAFSGLTASQSINYGTASIALSGTVSAAVNGVTIYPTNGETVTITINGNAQTTTISDATGDFSENFSAAAIPPATGYTITYAYAGNLTALNAAADDTSTTLTVLAPVTLALSSSAQTNGYLGSLTFTAAVQTNGVTPGNVTGSVTFETNGVPLSTDGLVSGVATSASVSTLPRGINLITAIYSGDSNHEPATNTLNQIVTNHPPVAALLTVTRTAGLSLTISLSSLTNQWSDVDGDSVTLAGINLTTTNNVTLSTNGPYIFYPATAPNQSDQINYSISDGQGGTAAGIVNITVNGSVTGTTLTAGVVNNGMTMTVSAFGIPDYSYYLQRTTNLAPTVWVTISTNTAATNGLINATDNFSDLGGVPASAYYRLQWNP